jgi:hypothetical protein
MPWLSIAGLEALFCGGRMVQLVGGQYPSFDK